MTDAEAYEKLATKVRAKLSARKMELYQTIERIEFLDEMSGEELVRTAGNQLFCGVTVGETSVEATDEQPGAFRLRRRNTEWRAYLDEVKGLLEAEESGRVTI